MWVKSLQNICSIFLFLLVKSFWVVCSPDTASAEMCWMPQVLWQLFVSAFIQFIIIVLDYLITDFHLQQTIIRALKEATDERPWLWAVFIIVVVLPVVLIVAYCCMSKVRHWLCVTCQPAHACFFFFFLHETSSCIEKALKDCHQICNSCKLLTVIMQHHSLVSKNRI